VAALGLYVRTLMPGLGLWDTAEFQALGPVLGIAHPTGYPSYTLLLWLASVVLQPFGDPALRANLLSALLVAGAAALVAVTAIQLTRRPLLGLFAGMALALAPTVWRNALRADPHPFHLFLTALLLVLLITWAARQREGDRRAGRWLVAAAATFGVALGNHALTVLLAPGVVLYVLLVEPHIVTRQPRLVAACVVALVATAALAYAYIPLRASMDPPLDYAHPVTWEAFRYLVLGEQFQGSFGLNVSIGSVARASARLGDELGLVAGLVPVGFVVGIVRYRALTIMTAAWLLVTWAFALDYSNADIERYELVPILVAALWATLAVDWLWDALPGLRRSVQGEPTEGEDASARPRLPRWVPFLLATMLVAPVAALVPERYARVDASGDTVGRDWLEATLAQLAPNAVVVSWWSFSTPLWYARWVEGRRPDVDVIDDRAMLDQGLGDVGAVIERWLGSRPVYLIRLDEDIEALGARYVLEEVPDIPAYGLVYRVTGRVGPAYRTSAGA
jgi:hypothetical protein